MHRHGRLDRIAVTQYDERGEACGLALLFGLFTSRALRTTWSTNPYSLASSAVNQRSRSESEVIVSSVWPVCWAISSAIFFFV